VAGEIRASANNKCKAFCEARRVWELASGVTALKETRSLCRKLDLGQQTLASGLEQVASDVRKRGVELEGLSLTGAAALVSGSRLEQELFTEEQETTTELGTSEEVALVATGANVTGDWYAAIEVETGGSDGAVALNQLLRPAGDDGKKATVLVPHQVQEEGVTTPLGLSTVEDLQVFHGSQWVKIVAAIQLDYWADAEKHLVELQNASTWFLGQNQEWLSIEEKR
jgi:hypothetical protein